MFRPDDIGKIFGQDHIQEILLTWVEDIKKIPQSILVSGPFGVGKTTIARILANHIVKYSKDLKEINAADNRGIDDVRGWIESSRFSPLGSGGKVYIIDELHQMTNAAQSALLKVIEEPPPNVYFFLCTTEAGKLIPTIRSRCTILELRLFEPQDTQSLLSFAFNNQLSKPLIEAIHKKSAGHARDAVKMAELALLSNICTVEELDNQVGLGYSEIEKILYSMFQGNAQWQMAVQLLKVQDPYVIDNMIDQAMTSSFPSLLKNYASLLKMRILRKEFKISLNEQTLHLLSVFFS